MTLTTEFNRRAEILAHSSDLLRRRGFNAFSHRDLAALVGLKSSTVHYYFPTKEDIGLAVMVAYREEVAALLQSLEPLPVPQRLERFAALFGEASVLGDRWCLAGMLASDYETLGAPLRAELRRFFDLTEGWLAAQASQARVDLAPSVALELGKTGMALLEGALLLARAQAEPARVEHAAKSLKLLLGVSQ